MMSDGERIIELCKSNPDWSKYQRSEIERLLPTAIAELEIQASANINNKIKINAGYGILANQYCRWKRHVNAEAITSSGQLSVRGVGHYIQTKTNGLETQIDNQYYDTDSLFINYPKKLQEIRNLPDYKSRLNMIVDLNSKVVQPLIDEYFDGLAKMLNAVGNKIKMDFELIADKSIFLAPKKYVMRKMYDDGTHLDPEQNIFKLRGVEIVRTTTPVFFREKLKEVVMYIFNKTNDELIDFIAQTKEQFLKLNFTELANPSGVNGMEKYADSVKRIPMHVLASQKYNRFIEMNNLTDKYELIVDKSKIKYAYVKEPNLLNTHVIAVPNNTYPEELKKYLSIDYEHQFDKCFLQPIRRFLKVIHWEEHKSYSWDDIF